jgi:hypothetical protein
MYFIGFVVMFVLLLLLFRFDIFDIINEEF